MLHPPIGEKSSSYHSSLMAGVTSFITNSSFALCPHSRYPCLRLPKVHHSQVLLPQPTTLSGTTLPGTDFFGYRCSQPRVAVGLRAGGVLIRRREAGSSRHRSQQAPVPLVHHLHRDHAPPQAELHRLARAQLHRTPQVQVAPVHEPVSLKRNSPFLN